MAFHGVPVKTIKRVPTQFHGFYGFLEHLLAEDQVNQLLRRNIQGAGKDIAWHFRLGRINSIHLYNDLER